MPEETEGTNEQQTTTQPQQEREGGAGRAEEDRSGVGRTYCFRIAIVKLSGVQWGTWIIIDEYLSVVILSDMQHGVEGTNPTPLLP